MMELHSADCDAGGGGTRRQATLRRLRMLRPHVPDKIFFFQAEDGIRDTSVTGVQTCALPIYLAAAEELFLFLAARAHVVRTVIRPALEAGHVVLADRFELSRSEERRVGKECNRPGGPRR